MFKRLFVLFVPILLMGAECEAERLDSLDEGYMQVNGGDGTANYPWFVTSDHTLADEEFGFDPILITEAISNWHFWVSDCVDPNVNPIWVEGSCEDGTLGCITVSVGYTGDSYEEGVPGVFLWEASQTGPRWDGHTLLSGTILISSDYTYHDETVLATIEHEIGHTIPLADDPGPPVTVDLNSIMGSPLNLRGTLTPGDTERVCAYVTPLDQF